MNSFHKISVKLNDRSFEYDVYTLVTAFFQGVDTRVYDPDEDIPGDTDLLIEVMMDADTVSIRIYERQTSPDGISGTGEAVVPEMLHDKEAGRDVTGEQQEGERRAGPGMLRERTARILPAPGSPDRTGRKNLLKAALYEMLRDIAGRDLPWGDLTGIRPVRLATDLLAEPEAFESRADIRRDAGAGAVTHSIVSETAGRMRQLYYVSPRKAELASQIALKEKGILDSLEPSAGYSLYVGIPFCPSICLYCSFSSSPIGLWKDRTDEYLDCLIRELSASRTCFPGKKLQTVYIGGGTPTSLEPYQLDRLFETLEKYYDMGKTAEFTVEAGRPDSITQDKLRVLKKHGVSRISINPQTMNQKTLDLIGRRHTVEQTVSAFHLAREMGFDNINMDLIVGLPGEGLREVSHTMDEIVKLEPDSVTVHALALKRAARLALHIDEYEKISFQASDDIMECCENGCRGLQMEPYYLYRQKNMAGNFENTGYAKPGKECLYNILIMEEAQCILACGASGSTKIVYGNGRIERVENVKDVRSYIERTDEMIARKDILKEQRNG